MANQVQVQSPNGAAPAGDRVRRIDSGRRRAAQCMPELPCGVPMRSLQDQADQGRSEGEPPVDLVNRVVPGLDGPSRRDQDAVAAGDPHPGPPLRARPPLLGATSGSPSRSRSRSAAPPACRSPARPRRRAGAP
ncbi:uncharacterized protein SOCE836_090160 [Sorangium cellulosum]|uniref:Uncharacterized protein n=1 Tax=Sorangium cellulosum TaxID=56 RepID=A0A4P2R1J4_SORCE|nr:uncharacterized protein SOCE836_090160 [Sorangium cellulosum]